MSFAAERWVWEQSYATGVDKLVLLALARRAREPDDKKWPLQAWPSVEELAQGDPKDPDALGMTGLAERTVRAALRRLEALGEVKVDYRGGRSKANLYTLTLETRQLLPGLARRKAAADARKAAAPSLKAAAPFVNPAAPSLNPAAPAPEAFRSLLKVPQNLSEGEAALSEASRESSDAPAPSQGSGASLEPGKDGNPTGVGDALPFAVPASVLEALGTHRPPPLSPDDPYAGMTPEQEQAAKRARGDQLLAAYARTPPKSQSAQNGEPPAEAEQRPAPEVEEDPSRRDA